MPGALPVLLSGGLAQWAAGDAGVRFADVGGLLGLPHHGRTRLRFSLGPESVVGRFEGGTDLVGRIAIAVDGAVGLDLTAECITHRFTPGSKQVLEEWYPRTRVEMDPELRREKHGKYGAVKHVYPDDLMAELREHVTTALDERLPGARILYWT